MDKEHLKEGTDSWQSIKRSDMWQLITCYWKGTMWHMVMIYIYRQPWLLKLKINSISRNFSGLLTRNSMCPEELRFDYVGYDLNYNVCLVGMPGGPTVPIT
jgi:hypothetical protein